MLKVSQVTSGYKRTMVLDNCSLEVKPGEIAGLLGRNGVGKSTALKTIMGLLPVKSGTITFDGQEITNERTHRRARRGIAYVPQGRQIFAGMSVQDNIKVACHGAGVAKPSVVVNEVLANFEMLNEKKDQPGGELSGGQQQILAIARALVSKPKLLLLDEPSEGIQPTIVQQIGEIIADLASDQGISVLLVEQNFDFVTSIVGRLFVMDSGRIVHSGPPAELRANEAMQQEYLGLR
ncbi:MAG: ABC transporter ATP-binding protein [Micrococcales bacterium]|nr:ABC transporter ATP-binding protein [Micrococcales bacterium]